MTILGCLKCPGCSAKSVYADFQECKCLLALCESWQFSTYSLVVLAQPYGRGSSLCLCGVYACVCRCMPVYVYACGDQTLMYCMYLFLLFSHIIFSLTLRFLFLITNQLVCTSPPLGSGTCCCAWPLHGCWGSKLSFSHLLSKHCTH